MIRTYSRSGAALSWFLYSQVLVAIYRQVQIDLHLFVSAYKPEVKILQISRLVYRAMTWDGNTLT